jgi:hypothetical protein
MPAVKDVGEPCEEKPHARFDGGREETSASRPSRTAQGASRLPDRGHPASPQPEQTNPVSGTHTLYPALAPAELIESLRSREWSLSADVIAATLNVRGGVCHDSLRIRLRSPDCKE